jgi:cyclic pyranopterin phosphate synthase
MVDVSDKAITHRSASASCVVRFPPEIWFALDQDGWLGSKGPILQTAIVAGVQAAKRTSEWIPFCHPLALDHVSVQLTPEAPDALRIVSSARCTGRTGVEMEALTAASAAALTVYDMCKALSHELSIEELHLLRKSGGRRNVGVPQVGGTAA